MYARSDETFTLNRPASKLHSALQRWNTTTGESEAVNSPLTTQQNVYYKGGAWGLRFLFYI